MSLDGQVVDGRLNDNGSKLEDQMRLVDTLTRDVDTEPQDSRIQPKTLFSKQSEDRDP